MKQLTGLDATFLYMETDRQFGHVSSLSIYDRPDDDPDYDPFAAWRGQVERRLPLLEPLRRKLRDVPFRLDHPFWIDDDEFDLDFHVRHTAVPPPGSDEQLGELVARIVGRPLDRTRPLWESYVIEGLPDGRFGILTKVHHATVDGASGVELLTMMLDADREGDDIPEAEDEWQPEPRPSDLAVLSQAMASLVRKPARGIVLAAGTMREIGQATRNPVLVAAANQVRGSMRGPLGRVLNIGRERSPEGGVAGPLPRGGAPRTPFNGPITAHRRFAFRSTGLDTVKGIKSAVGATVNDVVMAVCAGGLRAWLETHGGVPDRPLVAMIPVSIRTGEEEHRWTNRVSAIFAELPTNEPDPLLRIQKVHESMVGAKALFDAVPAERLTNFAEFPPPAVFASAMRTATRLTANGSQPVNLVISNVPGPREPLYAARAELQHYYPVSTIVDGQGLNVTVQSYRNTLDFGLIACRERVPDLWDMVDAMVDELHGLAKALGVDVSQPAAAHVSRG